MSLSRLKRALFYAVLVVVACALAEGAATIAHFAAHHELFSYRKFQAQRRAVLEASEHNWTREFGAIAVGDPPGSIYEVLHPYLGYVQDPTRRPGYSELGFPDSDVRVYASDPKRAVIAFFGGSFAEGLARTTKELMAKRLASSPRFRGKEIRILTVAMGGYKQPQQLLALAWLLSLGAHFDVVVNLDGLNEIALPAVDNVPKRVFPFYPRNWSIRMGTMDETLWGFARRHADLVEARRRAARVFSHFPLDASVTASVAWVAWDTVLARRMAEVNRAALTYHPDDRAAVYSARGPDQEYASEDALYDDLAREWKAASAQMRALASANGFLYLHFLQPNQYVPGSKEMSPQERAVAFDESHPYRHSVQRGYPKLVEKGRELRQQGERFFDLTMTFADRREPLYTDSCCHLGPAGYGIIASIIAEEIAKLP
jgi:hypothetical protein